MKITGSKIRPGQLLKVEGKLWEVLGTEHVKPGKGGAFTKARIQSIGPDPVTKEERFSSSENVELAYAEEKPVIYLYEADGEYFFMDKEHALHSLKKDEIDELVKLLQSGTQVNLLVCDEKIIKLVLPIKIQCLVEATLPAASGGMKPAFSRGVKILVPSYVKQGEGIIIDSRDKSFVERVKIK